MQNLTLGQSLSWFFNGKWGPCRQIAAQLLSRSHEIDDRGDFDELEKRPLPSECLTSQRDGMHSLFQLMADIHSAFPELWLAAGSR